MTTFLRDMKNKQRKSTYHVCERVADRSAGDTAIRDLDPGGGYPRFWIVEENVHPFPASEVHDSRVGE